MLKDKLNNFYEGLDNTNKNIYQIATFLWFHSSWNYREKWYTMSKLLNFFSKIYKLFDWFVWKSHKRFFKFSRIANVAEFEALHQSVVQFQEYAIHNRDNWTEWTDWPKAKCNHYKARTTNCNKGDTKTCQNKFWPQ